MSCMLSVLRHANGTQLSASDHGNELRSSDSGLSVLQHHAARFKFGLFAASPGHIQTGCMDAKCCWPQAFLGLEWEPKAPVCIKRAPRSGSSMQAWVRTGTFKVCGQGGAGCEGSD
jgi:hypothetical protein